jgi:Protein of unknown function (DUF1549)/Protein of unknown function (DUF1553)
MRFHRLAAALSVALLAGLAARADEPKPTKPVKPAPPQQTHPVRDAAAIAVAIDREIDRRLAEAKVPASPTADDAEFLRRAYLDLTGRIPTWDRAAAFLDSREPDKRAKLIDELLASPDFGAHQADVWRPLLSPRDPANSKPQLDRFSPWLTDQLNRNRGWDRITADLLGLTGDVKERPDSAFLMSHADRGQPRADLLATAIGKAFLGVQLQCAECHDHPFAPWKQADFWGVAAFFGKIRNTGVKGPPFVLTEDPDPKPIDVKNGGADRPTMRPAGAIVIPAAGGNKGAGQVIPAKVLGGKPLALDDAGPYRPKFIEWLTSRDNGYFARAFVNSTWAQLFGRGLVHPTDQTHEKNPPSHPALLDLLAEEFVASEFDIKHLCRCISNSKAYQRSSRSVPGNEADAVLVSKMAVKPVGPEALYDSMMVVYAASKSLPAGGKPATGKPVKPGTGKPAGPAMSPRDEFIHFFRGPGGAEPYELGHGIPQFLRRMNGETFNASSPIIGRMVREGANPERVIDTLFLATLTRRPTVDEQALMLKYVAGRANPEEGYAGVLWVLLNSGEFVLNR